MVAGALLRLSIKTTRRKNCTKIFQLKVFVPLFQKGAPCASGAQQGADRSGSVDRVFQKGGALFGRPSQRAESLFLRKKLRRGAETVRGTVSAWGTLARGSPKKFYHLCNLTFKNLFLQAEKGTCMIAGAPLLWNDRKNRKSLAGSLQTGDSLLKDCGKVPK